MVARVRQHVTRIAEIIPFLAHWANCANFKAAGFLLLLEIDARNIPLPRYQGYREYNLGNAQRGNLQAPGFRLGRRRGNVTIVRPGRPVVQHSHAGGRVAPPGTSATIWAGIAAL